MDGCLVDTLSGNSLRPGAREVLTFLDRCGHSLVLWSAGGADYARNRAVEHGIDGFFEKWCAKDERDREGYYIFPDGHTDWSGTIFVDDHPEEIAPALTKWAVSSYLSADPNDRELHRLLVRAQRLLSGTRAPR